ncbi:putative sodium/calcium exchanger membrane region [Dioscorea sansibarensis]
MALPFLLLLNISFLFLLSLFFLSFVHFFPTNDCHDFLSTSRCPIINNQAPCVPQGYIDYFYFFCSLSKLLHPYLVYLLLSLWLLVLFYILGNTASLYFCSSLEGLSKLLRLSPTIAGVTLLSLGNGASDVFASIVSFSGSGAEEMGLSSVIGGSFFVSSVVVGVISITTSSRNNHPICIEKPGFFRNISFLIMASLSLVLILFIGQINVWSSLCFASLYIVYVFVVSTAHCCKTIKSKEQDLMEPLINTIDEEQQQQEAHSSSSSYDNNKMNKILYILEMPLYLPRRLTIPDVSEERWSKPMAIASVFFSPLLIAALYNTEERLTLLIVGALVGIVLGITVAEKTESSSPPNKCLFLWFCSEFLMSVIWTYMTSRELVSLLVSVGYILGISPSVLGVTVLAWGNSAGDLMANVALALNGGEDGVQVAISGCYAGPVFNVLVGLGLSFLFSCVAVYPAAFEVPKSSSLVETLGFLVGGLLWALVMLPRRGMKLDRVLGGFYDLWLGLLEGVIFDAGNC